MFCTFYYLYNVLLFTIFSINYNSDFHSFIDYRYFLFSITVDSIVIQKNFFFNKFIYLFLVALGLCCCAWAFSSCGEWGLVFILVRRLLTVVASLVAEHGLQVRRPQLLRCVGSVAVVHGLQRQRAGSAVVVHRLSCSAACGIFLGQGSNPCPLHWLADF